MNNEEGWVGRWIYGEYTRKERGAKTVYDNGVGFTGDGIYDWGI